MSNTFSKMDNNNNVLHKLVSLEEYIEKKKTLSKEQKFSMSLDDIIKHKEIYDEEYVKQEIDNLNKELEDYFLCNQLDNELINYFNKPIQDIQVKKEIGRDDENDEDDEEYIWDYWGVMGMMKKEYEKKDKNKHKKTQTQTQTQTTQTQTQTTQTQNDNKNLLTLLKNYKLLNSLLEKKQTKMVQKFKKYKRKIKKMKETNKLLKKFNNKLLEKNGKKIYCKFISL